MSLKTVEGVSDCPQPIDQQIEADLAAGRLDNFMQEALDDDNNGRTQPL
jgi:hypothetical protein